MDIFSFIISADYRRRWRRNRAERMVIIRQDAVNHHVYVQEVFYFTEDSWKKKSYISVDGLRICDYTDNIADQKLLETLKHRYYVLHRHTILCR